MKRSRTVSFLFTAFFLLVLLSPAMPLSAQVDTPATVDITGINVDEFPDIHVSVYAVSENAQADDFEFELLEDGIPQAIKAQDNQEVGVQVALLIDSSSNIVTPGATGIARNTEVADAIGQFVQIGVLDAATDWLSAYAAGETSEDFDVITSWEQDHQKVANSLRQYEPSGNAPVVTPLFTLLQNTIQELKTAPAQIPENLRRSIIVFSDGNDVVSGLDKEEIVTNARSLGITIHTVLLGAETQNGRQNLLGLADSTGGEYLHLNDDQALLPLWEQLGDERTQTMLTYGLAKADPSSLTVKGTTPGGQKDEDTVDPYPPVPVLAPKLSIKSPANGAVIVRKADAPDSPLSETNPSTLPVTLAVAWPDDHPRFFERIEYEMNGITTVQTEAPFGTINLDIAGLESGNYPLRATGFDELGMESKAIPVSFRIDVEYPTPVPTNTPMPTDTPAPTATDEVTSTEDVTATGIVTAGVAGLTDSSPQPTVVASEPQPPLFELGPVAAYEDPSGEKWAMIHIGNRVLPLDLLTLLLILLPLVLLIAGLVYLFVGGGNDDDAFGGEAGGVMSGAYTSATISDDSTQIDSTAALDATAYELTEDATVAEDIPNFMPPAHLIYVEGGNHLPEKLDIEGGREVRIGRKPEYSDVLIDDKRISRLHASINEPEDGHFYIKDEGSSGGTFVNRRKLRINDTRRLNEGDVINFNTIAYRFEMPDEARPGASISGTSTPGASTSGSSTPSGNAQ